MSRNSQVTTERWLSDTMLFDTVEDHIKKAFGSPDKNTVRFKRVKAILHLLARQLRLLEQGVELKFDELGIVNLCGKSPSREDSGTNIAGKADESTLGTLTQETTGSRRGRAGSIQVVAASQFEVLEKAVKQLEIAAKPQQMPSLPSNKQLREDLAEGRASLSDTMQAMQFRSRIQVAEQGLLRMAGLLVQLAAAGLFPKEVAATIMRMHAGLLAALPVDERPDGWDQNLVEVGMTEVDARCPTGITRQEMQELVAYTKQEIMKDIENKAANAISKAKVAFDTSKNIEGNMPIALGRRDRIDTLYSQTTDYEDQLSEFDSTKTTKVATFLELVSVLKNDLTGGLEKFDSVNNSAETKALQNLNEQCDVVAADLEESLSLQASLALRQAELKDQLKNLIGRVEMLHEQKVDDDELTNGLRNKADISRFAGLVQDKAFEQVRRSLDLQVANCYEQFQKQDHKWENALNDITAAGDEKLMFFDMILQKKLSENELTKIQENIQRMEAMFGDPKEAQLMWRLSSAASCGACLSRALMLPADPAYGSPLPLPALRPAPPPRPPRDPLSPPDFRKHICHRWVGGSHTLLPRNVATEKANLINLQTHPSRKITGYGNDGRLYMLDEDLQPCAECNRWTTESVHATTPTSGGGDQVYH